MKTIGLLGGMSWESTLTYYQIINMVTAQTLGGLNAPITGFVTVLNGTMKGLVVALNAIAEKQGATA